MVEYRYALTPLAEAYLWIINNHKESLREFISKDEIASYIKQALQSHRENIWFDITNSQFEKLVSNFLPD